MPISLLNLGTTANDGTGTKFRAAGTLINSIITAVNSLVTSVGSFVGSFASLTGIPTTLAGYGISDAIPSSHIDTDGTASANSDSNVMSQKATRTLIETSVGEGLAQLPNWTYVTGGGTPGAGQFTADNDDPTLINALYFDNTFLGAYIQPGSLLVLQGGGNLYLWNVTAANISDATTTLSVNDRSGSLVNLTGVMGMSIWPFHVPSANLVGDLPAISGAALTNLSLSTVGISTVSGFAVDDSAGTGAAVVHNYESVDPSTLDGGSFVALYPDTASAIQVLSSQVHDMTHRLQALTYCLKQPAFPTS